MKFLKLLIIAVIIIGGIAALVLFSGGHESIPGPSVSSAQAKDWRGKIDALCKDNAWNANGYERIESGVHTDFVTSDGRLITRSEESSLQAYLFASSCLWIKEKTDNMFKKDGYPTSDLKRFEGAVNLLKQKEAKRGRNSNLTEAESLFSSYHRLLSLLEYKSAHASYSHPLRAYSGNGASNRKATIERLPYYKTHFSRNTSLKAKVNQLGKETQGAETRYYDELEKCIERHYEQTGDLGRLLEDQLRFDEISNNSSAKSRLNNFVNSN